MKNNPAYKYNAIVSTLTTFCHMYAIASAIAEQAAKIIDMEVDVYTVRADGFVLRKKKDTMIADSQMSEICCKAIKNLIKTEDGFVNYLLDNYDVEYDKDDVNDELIESVFEIKSKGRLISIEIDI